jgi:peptidyl-prolyl cis-trans isomerase SurA
MKLHTWAIALLLFGNTLGHAQTNQAADFIVALVNSEPITHAELTLQIQQVTEQRAQQRLALPSPSELRSAVLERMISDRAQLQLARETGIRIDAAAIDQAERNVAAQNQMDVSQLHKSLQAKGSSVTTFRDQLRDQLMLTRLHEREVDNRLRISDTEVDRALADRQATNTDPLAQDINLAQLLIALPEKPTPAQITLAQTQAQQLRARVLAGEKFEALVLEFSASERKNGGQLGLRRADRYPASFVTATQALGVGAVSELVRSDAGFHLLKVIDRRAGALVETVVQTRARHILLRTSEKLTANQASARLAEVRQRIMSGATSFEAAARDVSQDGSAAQGGDLGWSVPGMFVPEFDSVLDRLKDREISQPSVSRFGVHLIQLIERRRVELSLAQQREQMRSTLKASRAEEAFATWARDVRARAFVEIREP